MNPCYVIDANILFSAFISGRDIYRLLFSAYTIYLPDFAFIELEKYKARILKKTKIKEADFKEFVVTLLRHVIVIPNFLISAESLQQAFHLCQHIDEKDTLYVATAIECQAILITNDKKLYHALKQHHFEQIELLENVMNQLPEQHIDMAEITN